MPYKDHCFNYDYWYSPFDRETKLSYKRKLDCGKEFYRGCSFDWNCGIISFAEEHGCEEAAIEIKKRTNLIRDWIKDFERQYNLENEKSFVCCAKVEI